MMRKKLPLILLIVIVGHAYSKEITTVVTSTPTIAYIIAEDYKYLYLPLGDVVNVDEQLWNNRNNLRGLIKVKKNDEVYLVDSRKLTNPLDWKDLTAIKISSDEKIFYYDFKLNPFHSIDLKIGGEISEHSEFAIFDMIYQNNELFHFIVTKDGSTGWINTKSIKIDNKSYYSNTPKNTLASYDLEEQDVMQNSNIEVFRNGPILNIPSLDLELIDLYPNIRYRLFYSIDKFIIYRIIENHSDRKIIKYFNSDTTIEFSGDPYFNINHTMLIACDNYWSDYINFSLFDLENESQIRKCYQFRISAKNNSLKSCEWINNNRCRIVINNSGKDTVLELDRISNWEILDKNGLDVEQYVE